MRTPADPGLQAERTALSWRRTALSVAVGSLVGMRVLPTELGAAGYVVCALGLGWSLDLAVTARLRHRQADIMLRRPGSTLSAPGGFIARTAVGAALAGLVALVYAIASTGSPGSPTADGSGTAPAPSASGVLVTVGPGGTHMTSAVLSARPSQSRPVWMATGQAGSLRVIEA